MWDPHSDGAGGGAAHWRIVDVRVLEPLDDIPMHGATALHVNVLVDDRTIARVIVPCRSAVCSAARLRLHLEPFVRPALAQSLRNRFHGTAPTTPSVSIIVSTRNRARLLDQCLGSIGRLTGVDAEVIVVDNGDDDGETFAVAERHGATYVVEPVPGLDRARNRGLATASHDIVLFTDDDVEVDPAWAQRLAQAFEDPMVAAATGLVMPAELDTREQIEFEMLAGFVRTFDDFVMDGATTSPAAAGRAGAGASMAFRRDFLRGTGGFPDVLDGGRRTSSGGDTYALYKVLRAGRRIRFEPRAVVRHHHRSAEGDGARTAEGYARGAVAYLTYAAITERDLSALVAAIKWSAWRVGLLAREWLIDPRSRSTDYVRGQVRGSVTAPIALARAVRENSATAIAQPELPSDPIDESADPIDGRTPLVSVVIPTAGRRPGLCELVRQLHQQTHPVEIIVATDGDFEDRAALERALGGSIDACVVVGATQGAGDARNRGAAVANGDIVLFLDDDVLPFDDRVVARHVAARASGHQVAVGPVVGAVASGSEAGLSLSERSWWSDQATRIARGNALDFTDVCTGNLSIDRALLRSLGGFVPLARREDFELGIRVIERGHTVVGLSDASVWRVEMCTLEGALERRFKEGQADCHLSELHPTSMLRLGLGSWSDLGRLRRVVRVALDHPRAMKTVLGCVAPIGRLLDRAGSRRRLHRFHDVVGRLAYWSGVGAEVGGSEGWRALHQRLSDLVEVAPRSVLDLDRPDDWIPPHSGAHLVDVARDGAIVGVADMRWGGIPFDRDAFARTFSEQFAFETLPKELQQS